MHCFDTSAALLLYCRKEQAIERVQDIRDSNHQGCKPVQIKEVWRIGTVRTQCLGG